MIEQEKLEELMYVSLIGKFDFKNIADDMTYLGYTSKDELHKGGLRPVYVTSTKVQSESLTLKRILAFERRILEEENYLSISKENLSFSKRIKDYINKEVPLKDRKTKKILLKSYKNNMANLLREGVIDKSQCEAAVEYVTNQFSKAKENVLI